MKRIALVLLVIIGAVLLLVALDSQRAWRGVFMATMFQGVDMTDENDGLIDSVRDPVTRYLPELKGSA